MSDFKSLFSSEVAFENSSYKSLSENNQEWPEEIYKLFEVSVSLPEEVEVSLNWSSSSADGSTAIGYMQANIDDKTIKFPFVIKNNKISPFDVFIVNDTSYPLTQDLLHEVLNNRVSGQFIDKEKYQKQTGIKNKRTYNSGYYTASSLGEAQRLMDESKLAAYFKKNPDVAEKYYKIPSAQKAINTLLNKVASYTHNKKKANRILSAVATPLSFSSCKVAYLTEDFIKEEKITLNEALNKRPSEIAYLVKKALKDQKQTSTNSFYGTSGKYRADSGDFLFDPLTIEGPMSQKGNMINWNGKPLNYNIAISMALEMIPKGKIREGSKLIFRKKGTNKFTSPIYVLSKMTINNKVIIRGEDKLLLRPITITFEPTVKEIFLSEEKPLKVIIPDDWDCFVIPLNENDARRTLEKTSSYFPKKKVYLRTSYNDGTYVITGAAWPEHNGRGFSWEKTAAILNYYIGDKYKEAFQKTAFKHLYTPKKAITKKKQYFKKEPIFIKEAVNIAEFIEKLKKTDLFKNNKKIALLIENEKPVSEILNLNYMTENIINDAKNFVGDLENLRNKLTDLMITARVTELYSEDDFKKVIHYLNKIINQLKSHPSLDERDVKSPSD